MACIITMRGERRDDTGANLPIDGCDGSALARRLASEGGGTAFLLAAVVGSGIMGERLSGGNAAMTLLANSLSTGAARYYILDADRPWGRLPTCHVDARAGWQPAHDHRRTVHD